MADETRRPSLKTLGTFTVPPPVPAGRMPYGPPEAPPPAPLAFLAPWLEGAVDAVRGGLWGSEGAGDTVAAKAAELLSAGLPLASLKGLGFFSRVDKAVDLIPAKGAHPNKVASLLKSNASAEELAYRNVPQFLAGKGNATVTRAELAEHLAAHPAPMPVVKQLGVANPARPSALPEGWSIQPLSGHPWASFTLVGPDGSGRLLNGVQPQEVLDEALSIVSGGQPRTTATKYAQYQLPGGEDYRETLITLPTEMKKQGRYKVEVRSPTGEHVYRATDVSGTDVERLRQTHEPRGGTVTFEEVATPTAEGFRSGHFEEPNILVHTRANERTLPTGERGRFVEEVQSDWHQQGKKTGYQSETGPAQVTANDITVEESTNAWVARTPDGRKVVIGKYIIPDGDAVGARAYAEGYFNSVARERAKVPRVPDAPFKETWPDLGLKQQVLEAAEDPQASWIGFTSGQTQADRYDLSKRFSEVHYSGTNLKAYDLDGNEIISRTGVWEKDLPDYIGDEGAEKLLAQPKQGTLRSLTGVDLQVGGKGMKVFYDEILPKRLEKIVKPFGGTVERGAIPAGLGENVHGTRALGEAFFDAAQPGSLINGKLPVGPNLTLFSRDELGEAFVSGRVNAFDMPNYLQDAVQRMGGVKEPAWIAKLTPEMKAHIRKEGLPLLSLLPLGVLGSYGQQPAQEPPR